ncbi:MAG: ABC transporter permease, partial [Chloroflexota bacterium]
YMVTTLPAVLPYLEEQRIPMIGSSNGSEAADHSAMVFNPQVGSDLGTAWSSGRPVMQNIAEALPVSLEISMITTVLAMFISIPLGVISAVKRNTWVDYSARFVGILGLSIPNFVVATVLLLVPAMTWGYAPPLGYASPFEDLGKHTLQIVLPITAGK